MASDVFVVKPKSKKFDLFYFLAFLRSPIFKEYILCVCCLVPVWCTFWITIYYERMSYNLYPENRTGKSHTVLEPSSKVITSSRLSPGEYLRNSNITTLEGFQQHKGYLKSPKCVNILLFLAHWLTVHVSST